MFELKVNCTCPYCGKENLVDLAACMEYYRINNSEYDYTIVDCSECEKEYWLSHLGDRVKDIKEICKTDKLEPRTIGCWL